ncbi:MAG: hypothetical protein L0H96_04500 [Humibacillus sp.]|nr:hypothetical protein [Humibacillus sp.]MDN5776149.1 hypothetical protein [Humibacillus sp.]
MSSPPKSNGDTDASARPREGGLQDAVLSRTEGDPTGACVKVGVRRDLRSGGILGGPFDTARADWSNNQPDTATTSLRLYWVPLHAEKMPGVDVTAVHAKSGTTVKVFKDSAAEAAEWSYYDTNIRLPKAGTWRLNVSAGPDKGCFEVSLGA